MTNQTLKALEKKYGEGSMEYDIWVQIKNLDSRILIYPVIDAVLYLQKKYMKYDIMAKHEPSSMLEYEQNCIKTILRKCDDILVAVKPLSGEDAILNGRKYYEDLWLNWITTFFLQFGRTRPIP